MYDAILIVSFGGPDGPEDVIPFLRNVTRGRNVPYERLQRVAEHYSHFGGRSPINEQCRELVAAVRTQLENDGIDLPVYWGTRNWHPMLADTVRRMRDDGVKHAVAFVAAAYSSYSSCRQYQENIGAAQAEVGGDAPQIEKLRVFYNHPGFIEASADRVREALSNFQGDDVNAIRFVVSAHSIPKSMAETSDYECQLRETSRLVAEAVGFETWDLVFQSRSGLPSQAWLEPDIVDHLRTLHSRGIKNVLLAPLGFLSDHLEILHDLDTEAAQAAKQLGMKLVRAKTVGTHPAFVKMICQLIGERFSNQPRLAVGVFGPSHDVCPDDCCPSPRTVDRPLVLAGRSA